MHVIGFFRSFFTTMWTVCAVDILVESSIDPTNDVRFVGRSIAYPSATGEILVAIGLAASVGTIVAWVIKARSQRRRDRVLRDEVDQRWEEISLKNANVEARNSYLEWRLLDLERQTSELETRRDALLDDLQDDVEAVRDQVRTTKTRRSLRDRTRVVFVPDVETEATEATPG